MFVGTYIFFASFGYIMFLFLNIRLKKYEYAA